MKLKGAQILCESLLQEGVEVLFGYPGGTILPFYDALYKYSWLRHVLVRHEQAAAHAAEGYARVSGKVGVCIATSGPGATNLVTGLMAAKMDSVPLVAITGQVARSAMGKESFQECDTTGITRPATKRNYLVLRAADLASTVREAFHVATSGRPGPVLIDVPRDVQEEDAEFVYPPIPTKGHMRPVNGTLEKVADAARLINESKHPVIIAGRGVLLSHAWEELRTLAERANIPVINTLLGLGSFPRSHPLSLGMLGMHGLYWCNMAVAQADLILGIGMRFDDRVTAKAGSFGSKAKIVHIEVEPSQVNKNVKTDVALVGDARELLAILTPMVKHHERTPWFQQIAEWQRSHPSLDIPKSKGLAPQFVMDHLSQTLRGLSKSIVVTGVGQHQMWAAQRLLIDRPNSFLSSGGLGVMGYELPAAVGAQIGCPDAQVWSVAGDGGFQMTMQELATMVQERLPIKMVVFNNSSLGMVRQWQDLFYQRHFKAVDLPGPDFVKLADAYGIPALRITEQKDVPEALQRAANHPGPFLIDFVVDVEENVYPMVRPGAALTEVLEDPRQEDRLLVPES